MRNILIELKYNGFNYCGFASQKNSCSIYDTILKASEKVFCKKVSIYGCSRTDAKVHANQYFLNIKVDTEILCENIVKAFNFFLPKDIVVVSARNVDFNFHARFDAVSKEYIYKIYTSDIRNPFYNNLVYHYRYDIDINLINRACNHFIGEYDFKSFCSSNTDVKTTVRKILYFTLIKEQDDVYVFYISGNGFLYNMVRILVGTLLKVNEGKLDIKDIEYIINAKDRTLAGPTVPAYALYLNKVDY